MAFTALGRLNSGKQPKGVIDLQSQDRAQKCATFVLDKKAFNVHILDVRKISSLTDFLVIASGSSDRQVKAAAEELRRARRIPNLERHRGEVVLERHEDASPMSSKTTADHQWDHS